MNNPWAGNGGYRWDGNRHDEAAAKQVAQLDAMVTAMRMEEDAALARLRRPPPMRTPEEPVRNYQPRGESQ